MASGRNVINQAISLDGGDQVKKQLQDLGTTGEAAARKLERAFATVNLGKDFGAAASKFSTSFANLQTAASNFGSSVSKLGDSFGKVKSSVEGTATKIGILTLAFGAATVAVGEFVKAGLNAVDDLGDQAAAFGTTSQALQAYQIAAAASGIDTGTFGKALVKLNEVAKSLSGADTKDLVLWTQEVGRGFESATINGVKVTRTTTDASKAAGELTNKLAGLSGASLDAAKALLQLGITDFGKFKSGEQLLLRLSDAFQKFPDGANKTSIAVALLGEKLGPKLIPFLNMGSEGLKSYRNTLEALGVSLDDNAVKAAGDASDSLQFLGAVLEAFRNKFASLLAPAVSQAIEAIFASLKANGSAIDAFLKSTAASFTTFVQDLINLASGNGQAIQTQWLSDLISGFQILKTAAIDVYENALKPTFDAIRSTGPTVAAVLNSLFGTKLSGDAALIAVAIAQFLGVFKILGSVIGVVTSAFGVLYSSVGLIAPAFSVLTSAVSLTVEGVIVLGSVFASLVGWIAGAVAAVAEAGVAFLASLGPAGLVIAGIIAFAALVYLYWDQIKAATIATFTAVSSFLSQTWTTISTAVQTTFQTVVAAITNAVSAIGQLLGNLVSSFPSFAQIGTALLQPFEAAYAGIQSIMAAIVGSVQNAMASITSTIQSAYSSIMSVVSSILSAIQSAVSAAASLATGGGGGSSSSGSGFATGGYVRGAGTSTSDSIPAWLSNGEFVVRAAAVRKFGTSFFRALNGLSVPPSLRGGRAGFSVGGLVEGFNRSFVNSPAMSAPALAAANGATLPGKTFDLVIGNDRFKNLFAPEETAKNIVNFATQRKNRTLGRKPGWYGA